MGKYALGKVGWEGEGAVSVKVRRNADLGSDELIGVETRHKYKPLQLLALRGLTRKNTLTRTPGTTPTPSDSLEFFTHNRNNCELRVVFRQAGLGACVAGKGWISFRYHFHLVIVFDWPVR